MAWEPMNYSRRGRVGIDGVERVEMMLYILSIDLIINSFDRAKIP